MKHIAILIVFSLCAISLSAQQKTDEQRRQEFENLRAKRIDFFTKEIGLTTEEAKGFWPIFNELEEKKFEVNRDMRQEVKKIRDAERAGKSVSAAEYDRISNVMIDARDKELALEKEYLKRMQKILSPQKIFNYQRADYRFAREVLPPTPAPAKN